MVLTRGEEEKIYREEFEKAYREKRLEKIREKARRDAARKAEGRLAVLKRLLSGEGKPPIVKMREEIIGGKDGPVLKKIIVERQRGGGGGGGLASTVAKAFTPVGKKDEGRKGGRSSGGFINPFNGEYSRLSQHVSRGFASVFDPYADLYRRRRN